MSDGLTFKQRDCLAFIRSFIEENGGASPSHDQIKDHLGLKSKGNITRLLGQLVARGHITRTRGARSVALVSGDIRRTETVGSSETVREADVIICPHCLNIAGSHKCRAAAMRSRPLDETARQTAPQTIPISTLTGDGA